jgi:hypothetical protein
VHHIAPRAVNEVKDEDAERAQRSTSIELRRSVMQRHSLLGFKRLAVILLVGGAGCAGEAGEEEEVTVTKSAIRVNGGPLGHSYEFRTGELLTWQEAQSFCTNIGWHLADIRDAAEDAWLLAQERSFGGGTWWFGYNDAALEGNWRWSSGRSNGYVNWHVGEPNNSNNEDCAAHNAFTDGKWNDANCNNRFKFVCELGDDGSPTFSYNASNTNNDTANYAQWAVDITAGFGITVGTCGIAGSSGTMNTYLRLFNPWNSAQVAENNDFPNPPCTSSTQTNGTLSLFSYNSTQTGTYIIHAGCAGTGSCGGNVGITRP